MKRIPLTQGKFALIDDEDHEELSKHKWHFGASGYAARHLPIVNWIGGKIVLMHREILKPPEGLTTDHINLNKLDNRRANLRVATRRQNQLNHGLKKSNTSGFKGVSFRSDTGKYRATIRHFGKQITIGNFHSPIEAKAAYDSAAAFYHGEFARPA